MAKRQGGQFCYCTYCIAFTPLPPFFLPDGMEEIWDGVGADEMDRDFVSSTGDDNLFLGLGVSVCPFVSLWEGTDENNFSLLEGDQGRNRE